MTSKQWVELIIWIIKIIAGGASKASAVSQASIKFGVSESDIWKRGGF